MIYGIDFRRRVIAYVKAGQVGQCQSLIAPMIYQGSMTTEFFMEWFSTQLLPSLSEPHLIIMDNATFHPKAKLDRLCLAHHHYFLPLPPYSPELNPIERTWANLKNRVSELMAIKPSVTDCLAYCLKT